VHIALKHVISEGESVCKCVEVTGGSSVHEPSDALKAGTGINDLDVQFFSASVMERLVLHEHHVSDFETPHEELNGWSEVAATTPNIFDVGDLVGWDS